MRPPRTFFGCVWVTGVIAVLVMNAVDGHPEGRGELQAAGSEEGEAMLEPGRTGEAAMGEQAVKAQIDPENANIERLAHAPICADDHCRIY